MLLASSAVPLVGFRGSVSAMMRRFLATILVSSLILLSSGEPAMAVSKPPSTPTNVGISDCIESCQPMVISTLTPTVFATSTDVDSPQLSYGLELRIRSASSLLGTYAGSTVPPGTQGQVQIPGGILSDGEVYEFRLRISDGSGYAPATWIAFQPKLAADTPTRVWGFPKLVGDVTWSPAGSPYVLEGGVEVGQGATLRLTPGTIVKERGGFIYVTAGRLLARGNAASPIHFTSIEDDSVGGDSGQDGPTQGSAGNFSTILTISTTAEQADQAGTSIIENAAFRYGGWYSPARCYADRGMIKLSGEARLSIERSAFSDTATTAISMEDTGRWGLGLVRVSRSLFERMGTCALDTQGAKAIIEANVFADTDSAPISTLSDPGHGVTVRDNWFYGALSHFTNLQPAITREDIDYRGNAFMGSFGNAPAGYLDPEDLGGNYWPSNVGSFPFCIAPGVPVAHYVPPVDVRYNSSCPSTSEAYRLFTKVAPYGAPPAQPQVGLEAEPSTAGSVLAGQLMGVGSAEFARNPSGFQADPVNTANGAYVEQAVDATLPVLGGQLSLDRTYNSVDETAGPLGRGWTWGMAPRLKVSANGEAMLTAPDGQQATFFRDDVAGTFVPAPGVTAELTLEDDGYDVVAQSDLRYRFDIDGAIRSITDRNGNAISYQYDDGRITRIASGGRGFDLEWDGERLTKATLPDGRYVAYGYTGGLLTSVHGTDGQAITYTYDSGGRLITKTDQLGHVQVALAYGQTGRVVQQTNALGKVSLFTWDEESSTATLIDPRGGRWKDVYRGNVLVERRDPVGGTTTYEYDARMRLVATEDVRGFRSTFVWSGEDLVSARTSLGVTTFEHDSRSDLVATHDALGRTSVRVLDERGNVVRVERGGQQGQAPQVSTFDYDAAGFLVREVTPMGRVLERTRNAHGDVTSLRATSGATTQMGYDEVGRLTSVTTPRGQTTQADDDFTTTMGFDDGDRVVAVVDPRGRESQNTYDAAGRLLTSTDRAGRETTFSYRDDNTLSTRKGPDSASQPMRFAYDDNANLVSVTDPSGRTQSYGYDLANRVVSTSGPSGAYSYKLDAAGCDEQAIDSVSWTYDAVGNRTSESRGGATTTYDRDPATGRLTSTVGPSGSTAYSYDAAGRLLTAGDATLAYDSAGRLVSEQRGGGGATNYTYDGDGRRLSATTGAETTNFLWDPSNYLLNATTNRDGAATADVTYGLGPVAETRGGDTSALHTDTAGSVVEMTDGSGASVGTASFEPYGVERGRSGARSVLGWEGQLQDVAGSYHLRARQYHPDLGQFVAPDPARAVLDSATYSYANSNPMTTSDPLGLWPTDGTIGDAVGYVGSNVAGMFGVGVVLQAFRACEGSEKGSCGADVVAMAVVGGAGKGLGKAARAARGAGSVAAKTGTVGVDDVLNGVRLRAQLTGQEISGGHAFEKHILDLGEFPGIRTRAQFASHIEDVVLNGEMRTLGGGRTAFWRDGTVVIRNPRAPDGGTVFQPTDGYDYFLNQLH